MVVCVSCGSENSDPAPPDGPLDAWSCGVCNTAGSLRRLPDRRPLQPPPQPGDSAAAGGTIGGTAGAVFGGPFGFLAGAALGAGLAFLFAELAKNRRPPPPPEERFRPPSARYRR